MPTRDPLPLLRAPVRPDAAGCRMPCRRCASRRATSRRTAAGCARRGGPRLRCSPRRTGSRRRSSGGRWAPVSPGHLGGGPRPRPRPAHRHPAGARPRGRRGVRRGRPDQREGVHAGQVRPGRAAHAVHRLQRPVLHVVGGCRPPTAPSGSTAASPSRSPTSGARMPCSSSARTRRRRCRRSSSTWPGPGARWAAGRRPRSLGDGAAHRGRRRHPPRPGAGHRPRRPPRPDPRARRRGAWSTRSTCATAPTGWDAVRASVSRWWPERAETVCGIPADVLRATARRLAAAAPVHGGRGAYVLTGRGWSSRPRAPTASRRPSTSPSRSASSAGWGRATARSPGRATARAGASTGSRATSCPGYRMIADPAARAHVAAVWGVDPDDLPGRACPRSSCSAARHRGRPAGPPRPRRQPGRLGPERLRGARGPGPPRPPRRRRRRALRDRRDGRRRAARDPVGRGGGHHDDPRGPGRAAPQGGRPTRSRHAPSCGSGPSSPAAPATTWPTTPARSSTSWPAPPPGAAPTTRRSPTTGSTPARRSSGRARPRAARGHAPPVPRALPDGRRTGAPRRRRAPRPRRRRHRPHSPVHLVTGRVLHHYQSGAQTRRVAELVEAAPEPVPSCTRCSPTGSASPTGMPCASPPRAAPSSPTAAVSDGIRPDTVFLPFHWAGDLSANLLTNDAVDPVSGMPEFKVCAVQVERASVHSGGRCPHEARRRRGPRDGRLPVRRAARRGRPAGAGTVLGKEPVAAYNRVLLSSVVAGRRAPACSGWPGRRTSASRCSPASGRRRSTGTAGSSSTTGPRAPVRRPRPGDGVGGAGPTDPRCRVRRGPRRGRVRPQGHGRRDRHRGGRGPRPAGGRPRRRGARGGGRHRPGEARPQRSASCTSPTDSWSASSAGRRRRWRSPASSGSASRPTSGPPSGGSRPAAAGSRASASRDGVEAAADLFVMCTGTVAETMLARRAGLTVDRGIVVTDDLREPRRPARARHRRLRPAALGATGLVAQGWQQAAALVATLATGAVSPSAGRGHPRRRPGQGVGDVDGQHGHLRGLRPRRPPLPRAVAQGPRAWSLRGGRRRGRPPRRRDVHRGRGGRGHAVGALHPLAAGPRGPRAPHGEGAGGRRHGIRGEAPRGARRRRPRVHLQLGVGRPIREAVRAAAPGSPTSPPPPGRAPAAATAPEWSAPSSPPRTPDAAPTPPPNRSRPWRRPS